MALHTFVDSNGNPNIFYVNHDENGRYLNDNIDNPDNLWNPDNEFVFRNWFYFSPVVLGRRVLFHAFT